LLCIAENPKIRQASWECLACIASGYYDKLPAYMQDIFSLTQRTVNGDEEDVVLQALEFWCTVAEEELDRDGVSPGRARLPYAHCCLDQSQPPRPANSRRCVFAARSSGRRVPLLHASRTPAAATRTA
jgi:hypothetical protein